MYNILLEEREIKRAYQERLQAAAYQRRFKHLTGNDHPLKERILLSISEGLIAIGQKLKAYSQRQVMTPTWQVK